MRFHEILAENPNLVTVYHGDQKMDAPLHSRMFFSTDRRFAEEYGSHISVYQLNQINFIDSRDEEMIEPLLPLYDPYTDHEINNMSDYMDRASDTWEIIEDHADELVAEHDAAGIIIYEGGIKNFIVYDPSVLTRL